MLDFLFVALMAIVILVGFSIWLVRVRRQYEWHKRIQLVTVVVLALTIVAFELDIRFLTDWRRLASVSPYYDSGWVDRALAIHLLFAVPTPFLWTFTVIQALRHIPRPPGPCPYSRRHRIWGWTSAVFFLLTAVTGWVFYWMAFVA